MRCLYIIEFYRVIYPRYLTDDEKKLCNQYETYFGPSDIYNNNSYYINNDTSEYIKYVNDTLSILNISDSDYNIPDRNEIINRVEQTFNVTMPYNESTSNNTNYQQEHQKMNEFCMEQVSYTYFFDAFNLNINLLIRYWLIVILICIALRVTSILIMLGMNNNIFTFIYKKIINIFSCQCLLNKTNPNQENAEIEETEDTEDTSIEIKYKQEDMNTERLHDIQEENESEAPDVYRYQSTKL